MRIQNRLFVLFAALLLAGCSEKAYQEPDGTFTLQSRSAILGSDKEEPEEGLVVGSSPAPLHFAPDAASKTMGEIQPGTGVVITAHVLVADTPLPWLLVRAGDKEGYLVEAAVDRVYRKKAGLALVRIGDTEPGTPLVADVVLERNFQLADGTIVPRDQVVVFTQPAFLETDASWMVVDGPLSAYSRFFDRNSEVTLPPGTRGVVLGLSELPADSKAALSPFHSPALVRTQDGTLLFVSLSSLLLHPQNWAEGVVGSRSVVKFQLKDPFLGRYGRLEAWSKDGNTLVTEGENEPGDVASVEPREGPPVGKALRVVRRLQARTVGGFNDAPAESVVEDWYRPDESADAPWGFLVYRNALSLHFTAWVNGLEETHDLKLSGLAERFKGNTGELLGSYSLSTWIPPSEPTEAGEEYGEEPPSEDQQFSGSLSFALTVTSDDGTLSLGTDGRFTDVDLPESRKPENSEAFWNSIEIPLLKGVEDAADELFPIWYP